ncbi:hypothetical protein HYC85_012409 [Camellia sinensis]|uniref:Glutaredoxin domain-containing protein n=1 Tax=Camellia sinensis TaxID=4442 RepID=A0A7J7HF16_CAMSI|nr:hypothetical protein HYC85_012409 [Camellia sinensis]
MRYSTTVPNYPDTHEDFMPTNKLQNPDLSLKDIVEQSFVIDSFWLLWQDVNDNPMMIYMKEVPDLPRCGFGSLAVRVLKEYNVPLSARNVLEDPELKNVVKSFRPSLSPSRRYVSLAVATTASAASSLLQRQQQRHSGSPSGIQDKTGLETDSWF